MHCMRISGSWVALLYDHTPWHPYMEGGSRAKNRPLPVNIGSTAAVNIHCLRNSMARMCVCARLLAPCFCRRLGVTYTYWSLFCGRGFSSSDELMYDQQQIQNNVSNCCTWHLGVILNARFDQVVFDCCASALDHVGEDGAILGLYGRLRRINGLRTRKKKKKRTPKKEKAGGRAAFK